MRWPVTCSGIRALVAIHASISCAELLKLVRERLVWAPVVQACNQLTLAERFMLPHSMMCQLCGLEVRTLLATQSQAWLMVIEASKKGLLYLQYLMHMRRSKSLPLSTQCQCHGVQRPKEGSLELHPTPARMTSCRSWCQKRAEGT